jgi:sulfiredoxin
VPEEGLPMMKREMIPVAEIYVPVKRRAELDQTKVDTLAASILEEGQKTPIMVRRDGARYVLVEGLHRLEAAKALGETKISGYLVEARKH